MQFTALPESEHPRVLLRPIVAADLPVWFDYLSLPDVHEHTSWKPEAPSQLEHYDSDRAQHTPSSPFRLAIADRSHGRMLGSIGFHTVSPENRTAELAYDLSPPAWGQGIASAMAKILVEDVYKRQGRRLARPAQRQRDRGGPVRRWRRLPAQPRLPGCADARHAATPQRPAERALRSLHAAIGSRLDTDIRDDINGLPLQGE